MIPFLIYNLLNKYRTQSGAGIYLRVSKLLRTYYRFSFLGLLIILFALIPIFSKSQFLQMNYKIIQGGDEIGWMRLEKNINGNRSTFVLISEIKTRIIFQIKMCAKETAVFDNGKLILSTQFRKTNDDVKVNKLTRFKTDKYEVEENGEKQNLAFSNINTNLLCLYFQEPVGISTLYSDNFECFVKVTKTDDGGYKVKFPDDNSNVFYYSGAKCTQVKINHTFYSATIIIKP